jgi:hypothetical protein
MRVKLMPLVPGRKTPMTDSYEQITDDPKVHVEWMRRGFNIALLLAENGLSAADFDQKEAARRFYAEHREVFTCITETRRGVHSLYQGSTRTRKMLDAQGNEIGDIKGNGYLVFPQSIVAGWHYHFVEGFELDLDKLHPFPEHLFPAVEKTRKITREKIRHLDAYLAKIESIQGPYSIKGTHRSAGLVRAAAICRDAGLSEAEATIKMLWWNTLPVVSPPWPHEEIARAVTRIYQNGEGVCTHH